MVSGFAYRLVGVKEPNMDADRLVGVAVANTRGSSLFAIDLQIRTFIAFGWCLQTENKYEVKIECSITKI